MNEIKNRQVSKPKATYIVQKDQLKQQYSKTCTDIFMCINDIYIVPQSCSFSQETKHFKVIRTSNDFISIFIQNIQKAFGKQSIYFFSIVPSSKGFP